MAVYAASKAQLMNAALASWDETSVSEFSEAFLTSLGRTLHQEWLDFFRQNRLNLGRLPSLHIPQTISLKVELIIMPRLSPAGIGVTVSKQHFRTYMAPEFGSRILKDRPRKLSEVAMPGATATEFSSVLGDPTCLRRRRRSADLKLRLVLPAPDAAFLLPMCHDVKHKLSIVLKLILFSNVRAF